MASALENYVNMVRRLSKSGYYGELAENLNDTIELLTKNYSMLDNVLGTLDTYQHSLGILYVLIAKFNSAQVSNAETTQMIQLFQKFVEFQNVTQVRFALHAYYELCHLFTTYLVDTPNCMLGIKLLALAIERIRGDCDTQLTPVHADLCQLSLKAINFKLALKFLDNDITTISTASDTRTNSPTVTLDVNTDAKYFLLYYYYGGMIYTAVKRYDRALYFYEVCISTPAMTMSHIMLEAYKKFIMVSLILYGKVIDIQKFSSQVLTRFMKPLAQMYHDLANAYATLSTDDLRNVMNKFSDVYNFDNNMGLVKLVVKSLYKKNIQRLTKTFLTLSLTDVAARVKLPNANEAEKLILKMIKSGEIYATINQKDGMVIFKESPEAFDSAEMFLKIQNNMSNVIELVKNINVMEEEILLNPVYIKKILGSLDDELTSQHSKSFVGDPTD